MIITCPHCQAEHDYKVIDHINIDRNPELRAKVQDLSCFRIKCPNCGETALAVHPCLYHDMSNQFMVWLWPEQDKAPKAEFDPLAGYRLRIVDSLNGFREKISILEHGLDDRTIEIMKLLLFSQLNRDLDVVELLFHEYDERTGDFRFVAVLSDGAEQYAAMPGAAYQRLHEDVDAYLYTPGGEFARIDMQWAQQALELLHELGSDCRAAVLPHKRSVIGKKINRRLPVYPKSSCVTVPPTAARTKVARMTGRALRRPCFSPRSTI